MGLTGDSLSILLFLASCMVACMIGAVTAPKGWRTNSLWAGAVLFGVSVVVLLGRFPRLEATPTLAIIAGLTPAVTVAVVALMLGRSYPARSEAAGVLKAAKLVPPKRRPAEAKEKKGWKPDMSLRDVAIYVSTASTWRVPYGRTIDARAEIKEEIRKRLYAGQVTAWGREHPETEEYQIDDDAWAFEADVRLDTSYAFFPIYGVAMHAIRLSKGEIEAAWPPKK